MKAAVLICFALAIDGLQALISLGFFMIASAGGTLAGGAVGCAIGDYVAGQLGCWVGGGILGIFGTFANTVLAPVLVPIGVVLGIAVNICLSIVLGGMLVALLWYFKFLHVGYLPGFLAELTPGVANIPFWTGLVVASILRTKASQAVNQVAAGVGLGALSGGAAGVLRSVLDIRNINTQFFAQSNPGLRNQAQTAADATPKDTHQRTASTLIQNIDGIRAPKKGVGFSKAVGVALGLCLLWITPAHAQGIVQQPDPVQYTVVPETPGPNELVRIVVDGIGTFLGNSVVTWQKNDVTVASGIGLRSYSFTTGGVGEVTRVRVSVASTVHGTITREFVFSPSVVHLVWEADTTAPPFYQGKALYTAGSRIKVAAFPTVLLQGARVPNNQISFQWRHNDALVPEQSGLGKNTFTVYGDQLQTGENILVDLYINSTLVGQGRIFVPAVEPQVLVYSRDPLRGLLLDQALFGNVSLSGKEVTLQAEPFFFANVSKIRETLRFAWTLNNLEATGPDSARGLLTLRQTGSGAGFASVGVTLQNTDLDRLIQSADTALGIAFGQSSSLISNLFGI